VEIERNEAGATFDSCPVLLDVRWVEAEP